MNGFFGVDELDGDVALGLVDVAGSICGQMNDDGRRDHRVREIRLQEIRSHVLLLFSLDH